MQVCMRSYFRLAGTAVCAGEASRVTYICSEQKALRLFVCADIPSFRLFNSSSAGSSLPNDDYAFIGSFSAKLAPASAFSNSTC